MSTEAFAPGTTPSVESWRDALTREEIAELLELDDRQSWRTLATTWATVAGALALVALWPNPLTVIAALFVLGARQLGLAVIMHEASHHTFLRDRRANDWVGNWLAAYPIWSDTEPYRRYHLVHHAHTATERDPDLSLAAPFPITKTSFWRKVWRDLSGQTGWKQAKLTFQRDVGLGQRQTQRTRGLKQGQAADVGWHKLVPVVSTNAVLFALCWLAGHPWVYLLWPVAWLTTYRLVMRIRAIAEHAVAGPAEDPLRNTRTTLARGWERLLLAPNRVNYHLEHHLIMTVPHYNLPRMHRMLKERGVLERALVAQGYPEVLRQATAKAA